MKFDLPITNAFDLIRIYESRMDSFKGITMASIITDANKEIADLWIEMGQKRGFQFKSFTDIEEGKRWLMNLQGINQ